MKKENTREKIFAIAMKKYGTEPEYLWLSSPYNAVLRHTDNKKWYAILMKVSRSKLGLSGDETVDILDIKCDPLMSGSLLMENGIFPGYHMHKGNWLTVLLDGTVGLKKIEWLLDLSYGLTASKKSRSIHNTKWIIPANPKYYDIDKEISESKDRAILWKQSNSIAVGDTVFIYVGAPVSAIRYQCEAIEVDIPYSYSDEKLQINRAMRLKIIRKFDKFPISIERMKVHGVFAVRGARGMPQGLIEEINTLYSD